ncbi:MAG: aldo/keto reductase [Candidatus Omnitrophota bacterium]|jgi:aryl-alcohol dehydrogenase-like predicted oxidoreductase
MINNLVKKMCLGTAQFGLNYGIANRGGRVSKVEAFKILESASRRGINTLDTAYAYGQSENIVGKFRMRNNNNLKIISKLPGINKFDKLRVEDLFYTSLSRLKISKIYGYLIHEFDDFLKYENIWGILEKLKKQGLIQKIGFSLYRPEELKTIIKNKVNFDIIQFPYSIFDRRFDRYLNVLKEKGIEVHARSLFLQGLVFLRPAGLPKKLIKAKVFIKKLHRIAAQEAISIDALCLNFALLNPSVDKVIFGVDNLAQLETNIRDINMVARVKNIYHKLKKLSIGDERILLPNGWN